MAWTAPRTWVAAETLTAALLNAELRDNLLAGFPVGSLHYYIRAATTTETTINGFALECNATQVSRTTYSGLNTVLSALSYPFGTGNGSSTMHLPDLQGRTLVAMASGGHTQVNGVGDNDGYVKANRTPIHNTSRGSLSVSPNPHSHTYMAETVLQTGAATGSLFVVSSQGLQFSGDQSLAIDGEAGPGGTGPTDTVPYLVAGVWAVKY